MCWNTGVGARSDLRVSFNITYTYDAAGNRTLQNDGGSLTTYTYSNANRLLTAIAPDGTTTYTNDGAGNRTQETGPYQTVYYSWDAPGRMVTAQPPAGVVSLTYNADGQRVAKNTPDGATIAFLYDLRNLLQETDSSGDMDRAYVTTGGDEIGDLIAEYDFDSDPSGAGFYHQFDAQASTNALLDDSGSVSARYKYKAFGQPSMDSSGWADMRLDDWSVMGPDDWGSLPVSSVSRLSMGGQKQYYLDEETALYLLGSGTNGRYYDPATGRFTSEDPIREASGDENMYRYVGNNPVTRNDPSGQQQSEPTLAAIQPAS